jgi:hypothetical protein
MSSSTWEHEDQRKLRFVRESAKGNRGGFSKTLQAEEISTVDGSIWVRRKLDSRLLHHSQIAGVAGVSRRQLQSCWKQLTAADSMFPKGDTRVAARKGELHEQIAKAFCWSRQ